MLCSATPSVSEDSGDIRATALPCRAMLRVAATSHRQCQVTRRIQRLHEMDARVMMMRAVRATAIRQPGRVTAGARLAAVATPQVLSAALSSEQGGPGPAT